MFKRTERGQSMGEYAVLLGIILGAIVGMQALVRNRVAGALDKQANTYMTNAGGAGATAADLKRGSNSTSSSRVTMSSRDAGTAGSSSTGSQSSQNPLR